VARLKPAAPPTPSRSVDRRPDWLLLALLSVAAIVKLVTFVQLHDHPLLAPRAGLDSGVYLDFAKTIAGGDLAAGSRVYFVSPLYMYFAALVLAVSGLKVWAVQLAQVILGVATVAIVAAIARGWYGRRGGWIAAALAILTGYFTFNELLILQSALDAFLTALGLWLLLRAWNRGLTRDAVLAGLVLGLHVLNRPNVAAWAAVAFVLTLQRLDWRKALALAAGLGLAIAPVAIRNFRVAGELTLVSSQGGLNFYIGNGPGATGTYHVVPGITPSIEGQAHDMQEVAGRALGRPVTDAEASSWFYREARAWLASHPVEAVTLLSRKIAYVFNAADIALNDSYAYYSRDERTVLRFLFVGPWLLLPLGVTGCWLGRRVVQARAPSAEGAAFAVDAWWRMALFVPVYALSVAAFFVAGRYRLPLLVLLMVTSTGTVLYVWDAWRGAPRDRLLTAVSAVLLLAAATSWRFGLDDGRAGWQAEMILEEIRLGRFSEAEARFATTEPGFPNPALLHYRTGLGYLAINAPDRAIPHLERALALEPAQPELQLDLGHALLSAKRPADAAPHLEAALATHQRAGIAASDLVQALGAVGGKSAALDGLRRIPSPAQLDAASQSIIGRLALELGDANLAIEYLTRAARDAPDAATLGALGLALGMQGKRAEAIAALEQAVRLDPTNVAGHLNLAVAYAQAGRLPDARREAQTALDLKPDYERARNLLDALKKAGG
jgi:tetratricopeptide (TPR) repeat protein